MPNTPAPGVDDGALPPWAADLLARPMPSDAVASAAAQRRVMEAVCRLPRHGRPLVRGYRLGHAAPRWARRRGLLGGAGVLAGGSLLAAVLVAAVAGARLGPAATAPAGFALGATVLGDTVLGRAVLGRTGFGAAVRDTLRVVRFVLGGPAARTATRVALAAEVTGWRAGAPLARDARSGAWTVTVVVPRDAVRYAVVVDAPAGRRSVRAIVPPAADRQAAGDST